MLMLGTGLLSAQAESATDVPDSVNAIPRAEAVIRDSVDYTADSVFYYVLEKRLRLVSRAYLGYGTTTLNADSIHIDLENELASSFGQSWLQDDDHLMIGDEIHYDIRHQQGMIRQGATKFTQGFYYGSEIRKVGEDAYDIDDGRFTTCDAEDPDFYIWSRDMRFYRDDKIVARHIVFFVNYFPVFGVPFGTISVKKGRKSGLLLAEPGYNSTEGKYIKNLAYFLVCGENADADIALDWMEKTGWESRTNFEYTKRYEYNGSLSGRLLHRVYSGTSSRWEWSVKQNHHHDLGYQSTLDSSLEFVSSKDLDEASTDSNERLNERVSSRFSYKTLLFGRSLNVAGNYNHILTDDKRDITLPSITWSLPTKPYYELFLSEDEIEATKKVENLWYKNLSYSYSFKGTHYGKINDPDADVGDIFWGSKRDSTGAWVNLHNMGMQHTLGSSYSQKLLGWFNISQSINATTAWFDKDEEGNGFTGGYSWSVNSSANFSLYGTRRFDSAFISGVRHIVTPRVTYYYRPDFYQNDKFYSFGGIGLSAGKKARTMSFGLDNKWQLKLFKGDKTVNLNDFLSVSSSVSLDMEVVDDRFSNIDHDVTLNPYSWKTSLFDLKIGQSGSLTQNTDNFEIENWLISSNLTLSGDFDLIDYYPRKPNRFQSSRFPSDSLATTERKAITSIEELEKQAAPNSWELIVSHRYYEQVADETRTNELRGTFKINLTKNWALDYTTYADFEDGVIRSHSLNVVRTLHCWKLRFSMDRSGDIWNYRISIFNIKLPDALKFDTSSRSH